MTHETHETHEGGREGHVHLYSIRVSRADGIERSIRLQKLCPHPVESEIRVTVVEWVSLSGIVAEVMPNHIRRASHAIWWGTARHTHTKRERTHRERWIGRKEHEEGERLYSNKIDRVRKNDNAARALISHVSSGAHM